MSEIPVHFRPRRLSDWINPTDAKKVHSLIDKVYKRKNLEMAWEKVRSGQARCACVPARAYRCRPPLAGAAILVASSSPSPRGAACVLQRPPGNC